MDLVAWYVLTSRGVSFDALRFLNATQKVKDALLELLHNEYLIAFDACFDENGVFHMEGVRRH